MLSKDESINYNNFECFFLFWRGGGGVVVFDGKHIHQKCKAIFEGFCLFWGL